MTINIYDTTHDLGKAAGTAAVQLILKAIEVKGSANIILATGTSQFEILNHLIAEAGIDLRKVVMFHLDEYIGLPVTHPASFRKYLQERFLSKLQPLKATYLINGETDANATGVLQGSGIDLDLNERGVKQAEMLRNQFKNIHIDVIISSKLKVFIFFIEESKTYSTNRSRIP